MGRYLRDIALLDMGRYLRVPLLLTWSRSPSALVDMGRYPLVTVNLHMGWEPRGMAFVTWPVYTKVV